MNAESRPEGLTVEEERGGLVGELARRYNPAMAFPIADVWPVEVRYAWHDGAHLMARVEAGGGRPAREYRAVANRDLGRKDWSGLPHAAPDGRPIRYYVDAPGDDRPRGSDRLSSWRRRWRQIVQPRGPEAPPSASPYRPTQYAHVYWWNRARGLLAIQYWFYYPFNEWVNRHEADWEHIQIVLQGPAGGRLDPAASYTPVGHQFFFHGWWHQPQEMVRLAGADPREDHPLVYVGGQGRFLAWGGNFSGGSYPLPARFTRAGLRSNLVSPDDDTSRPARFIAAQDFQVILLPEPARLDGRRHPELSWLRLPFHAGQRTMSTNPPGYGLLQRDHPPVQPGVRKNWLAAPSDTPWPGQVLTRQGLDALAPAWPSTWSCVRPDDPRACAGGSRRAIAALGAGGRSAH